MTPTEVLAALEAAGTAQNRKIYARHGVTSPLHGVSFADLKRLRKAIGVDHEVALALWATGNHDARMLATMVADPARMGRRELDSWIREVDNYVLADAVSDLTARTEHLTSRADKWIRSRAEFTAHAGWALVGNQAMNDPELPAAYFDNRLARIEATMADAPNRTRHAMHMTLIAIGGRSPGLRRRAVATTKRIGTPLVDHGQTSCKTPDAIPYIDRMWERAAARA
jgi:3-methyladenine DNA glycosylase AlkD